ncbi:hypothetical protein ACFVFS_18450 [Kitasatospora sp. NPDC057692]|uniref:hypothetical protein n=1 Tax=Kitasatospora sp. NPDC057692 TaxID=3346215 RepID=UPI0036A93D6D
MSETLIPAAPAADRTAPAGPSAPSANTSALPVEPAPPAAAAGRRSPARPAHTRGGLPVVPLAVATGNTAVGAVSAAALAGGPLALALLAGGAAAATGAAALRSRTAKNAGRKGTGQTSNRAGAGHRPGAGGLFGAPGPAGARSSLGQQQRPARPGAAGAGRPPGRTGGPAGVNGLFGAGASGRRGAGSASPGRPAGEQGRSGRNTGAVKGLASGPGARAAAGHRSVAGGGSGSGLGVRAAQVRAARADRAASAPTRREKRVQDTAARRTVADARRAAKVAAREEKRAAKATARELTRAGHKVPASGSAGGVGAGSVKRTARKAARDARRQAKQDRRLAARQQAGQDKRLAGRVARDGRADDRVRGRRVAMRKGAVARAARKRLRRSAARYWARWALAALLAGAVGLIGAVTTPLGRRLDMPWLMHPGRRLFARMLGRARDDRQARDQAIADGLDAALAAAETLDTPVPDTDEGEVADTVPRAPRNHNSTDSNAVSPGGTVSTATGSTFSFAEVAAEMEALANTFDPDGMMQVLAMCEEIPDALQSIANVFKILAEKADAEFPLEAPIAEALTEVYSHIQLAVQTAGEIGEVFRRLHEQDIRRHEDPRNGEEKWDTNNN